MTTTLQRRARRESQQTYERSAEEVGEDLAWTLNPALGTTTAIRATCRELVKWGREHADWQVVACNRALTDEESDREAEVSAKLESLAGDLPHTDEGPIGIRLDGDPRAVTVLLVLPGRWAELHTSWGNEGIGVDL